MFQVMRNRLLQIVLGLGFLCLSSNAFAFVVIKGVSSFKVTTTYQGVARTTLYFKPSNASATTKVPLLVVLHYNGGTPEAMSTLTEVQELARDYGIFIAVPPVADGSWHDDPTDTSTTDDVGFLTQLIDGTVSAYPIDAKRVYMTGFSDGAMMTLRYACDRPDKIAAAAAVSGTMLKTLVSVCGSPSFATPMALLNGTADTITKYSPTPYGISLTLPDSAKHWAKINGCGAAPVVSNLADMSTSDGTTVTLTSYLGCATGDSVSLYTINNGGHTWPGSPYNLNYQGKTTFDIDGTLTIWNFVKRFSR